MAKEHILDDQNEVQIIFEFKQPYVFKFMFNALDFQDSYENFITNQIFKSQFFIVLA